MIDSQSAAGPSLIPFLLSKYGIFTVYALLVQLGGVPTIASIAGVGYEQFWGVLLLICSPLAFVGVIVSWRTERRQLELFATIAVIALLAGCAASLLIRGVIDDPPRIALAMLVASTLTLPIFRLFNIVLLNALDRQARASDD